MKITTLLLCFSLFMVSVPFAFAQTTPQRFEAEMLVQNADGKSAEEVPIEIVLEDNMLQIVSTKKPGLTKSFKYSDITSAEYTYSKKPRYATGAVLALAVTVFLLPIMFTKSKKHWMTVNLDKDYAVLKLKKSNYRMLLPAMKAKGINVLDNGDQNKKDDDDKEDQKDKAPKSKD